MSTLSDTVEYILSHSDHASVPSSDVRADVAGLSHQGHVRANNEDHFYIARFGRFLETISTNIPETEIASQNAETGFGMVVADGIGGSAAGEVASRLAISTLVQLVLDTPDWILRQDDDMLHDIVKQRAKDRYLQIGKVMADQAKDDPRLQGFGTTMTMAISLGQDLLVTHIGDSRAYLLRQETLHQLTRDHTMVQALVDRGVIRPQEVSTHRLRHVLIKSLGANSEDMEPDVQEIALNDGDTVLLCSDGLTEMVPKEAIAAILMSAKTATLACQRLIDEALKAGGKDNVTVVVCRYAFSQDKPVPASKAG